MVKISPLKAFKISSVLAVALLAAAALPSAASADSAANSSKATKWVHFKGIVVEVGALEKNLVGATIGTSESSKWKATVKADGSYDLKVPALTKVTRYVDIGDHLRIYTPTVKTTKTGVPPWSSRNIAVPSLDRARQLANFIKIEIAEGKDAPQDCVVLPLVAIKAFQTMTLAQVLARNSQVGVPGAKLTIGPANGLKPIYIGSNLLPDLALTTTTKDGIGIFIGVKPGIYKLSATKAGNRFSVFTATCKPGRVIFGEIGQQDGDQDD